MGGESMFSLPPNDIVLDLRNGMTNQGVINFELNEALFNDLYQFAIGGLEVYYDLFKQSDTCKKLKEEVQRQEVLYDVLRRYQMIQN